MPWHVAIEEFLSLSLSPSLPLSPSPSPSFPLSPSPSPSLLFTNCYPRTNLPSIPFPFHLQSSDAYETAVKGGLKLKGGKPKKKSFISPLPSSSFLSCLTFFITEIGRRARKNQKKKKVPKMKLLFFPKRKKLLLSKL